MSYSEINLAIRCYVENKAIENKQNAINNYILADLIGASVSRLVGKNNKMPKIEQVYPYLFEKKCEAEDWRLMKEKLLDFAEIHNRKHKSKEVEI